MEPPPIIQCLVKNGLIEYFSVDFAGNQEETKSFCCINIDQIPPDVNMTYEVLGCRPLEGWEIQFTATVVDNCSCSDIDRVEFYFNNELQETVTGSGPEYVWTLFFWPVPGKNIFRVTAWDQACNYASKEVNGSDIKSFFKSNFISNQHLSGAYYL